MQLEGQSSVSMAFFGDGTLGSGDLHETMNIAGVWSLPLILVCENNGWEMATPWQKVRKHRELIPYAKPFGFATRRVDGNDAWDVYHSTRWARATALAGQPVFLDCITFRSGTYSSHFGETRPGIAKDLSEWERRDPLKTMAAWLIASGATSAAELERVGQEEEKGIMEAFNQVAAEVKGN
jgi:pyruvate dehydrogenase E1 component alpha subunit